MNIPRGWFLVGLMFCLLLGGGAYFLLTSEKTEKVTPNIPTSAVKAPDLNPTSERGLITPTKETASSPQLQAGSVPTPAYRYNAQGQLQAIIYPDGSVYSYEYDAYGNKTKETGRTGKTWSYLYDQSHHPIAVIDPEGRMTHKEASPGSSNAN